MEAHGKNRNWLRRVSRKASRGMTLIEIMIVVIIMAMIATGVAVAVMPRLEKAKIEQARTDAAAIRTAVQMFLAENSKKCPTVEDLQAEKYLDSGKRTKDPWENNFIIQCPEG